ncbi:MAG: inositol monophosphatase [Gammaproteobacteria bacterium]|nr:inositol monophosphatase [Gammaproteobacteria bacterium]|tara:strand:+ start:688 stop:1383 length:696 start_codon:yes stop_codon:yes gene_type:complete
MTICNEIIEEIKSQLDKILSLRTNFVSKDDQSYVSEGDLLVQSIVLDLIKLKLPSHILISEELAPFDNCRWDPLGSYVVLDPIDGTENFVSGLKEWGVGISIFTKGFHEESCIYLPELNEFLTSGMPVVKFKSRIIGLSSSLEKSDLLSLPESDYEYRIIGCSMYNTLSAVKGSFIVFENVKGVNCWDVLPGLNLALENGSQVFVDDMPYKGEILFPTKKYKIRISNQEEI